MKRASAVLVVLIGWSDEYRGGPVEGGHKFLQAEPGNLEDCGEARLFERTPQDYFECGIGSGEVHADQ